MQLVMDSLRYWVEEMHVDGFRFDLAPVLARDASRSSPLRRVLRRACAQDPVLRRVKLIAEPWDLGPDGYQVGRFPVGWAEWNGKYRDSVRRFWRGDPGQRRRARLPPRRQQRPLRGAAAGARTRASTSSPATTASPCTTS